MSTYSSKEEKVFLTIFIRIINKRECVHWVWKCWEKAKRDDTENLLKVLIRGYTLNINEQN